MLDIQTIKKLFAALNDILAKQNVKGEIVICGGAVMCLVFHARKSTKDIDAIFQPTRIISDAAQKIANEHDLAEDWLNDSVKGFFLTQPPTQNIMNFSHLKIFAPIADYMLAMKCISARFDGHDLDDVKFLINHLNLKNATEVFQIITKYYPHEKIPAKTKFLVEEILGCF